METDKYKDFRELKDTDEMTLRRLFVRRNYTNRLYNPKADDIIIIDDPRDGFSKIDGKPNIAKKTYTKISSYKKRIKASAFQFPENNNLISAEFEQSILKPLEVDDYYTRKRVEAYLNFCKQIGRKEMNDLSDSNISEYKSIIYSFILIEAYYRGELKIKEFTKNNLLRYISIMFTDTDSYSIYRIVRRSRTQKNEYLNSADNYNLLKENYPSEYEKAMRLFPTYYPDL